MTTQLDPAPAASARASAAVELAQRWVRQAADAQLDPAATRLAGVLKDPNGLPFTIGFVDGVMRPESNTAAALQLHRVAALTPRFLPWHLRAAVKIGGVLAPYAPVPIVPIARRALRAMVGHLMVDARPSKLGPILEKIQSDGARLNLNLLGEAVLGEAEARRRLEGIHELVRRPDVDYVSVKISAIASRLSMWAFDEVVDDVVARLTPLFLEAAAHGTFLNLDMEEYRDLDLTITVFTRILDHPQLQHTEAGIVLQAYLPDAPLAYQRLLNWARERVAAGGARIKVRLVKGANLAMEHVDATLHGWPLVTYDTKLDADANYLRVLHAALTPENTTAIRLGIAGHNLFDVAYSWLLAGERGVTDDVEYEMLLGMAQGQVRAVSATVGGVRLYVPVVHPDEFDVAISYLIRRLEENASSDNFLSAAFELADDAALLERERSRFLASMERMTDPALLTGPRRTQDRGSEQPQVQHGAFANVPDTDPALPANRAWARTILERIPTSELGAAEIAAAQLDSSAAVDAVVAQVRQAAAAWGERSGAERANVLRRAGALLEERRAELIEVAASETGKIVAEGDVEVSEAVDFANYYAAQAEELDAVAGARFSPRRLTVVTPPWNFPLSIPAGGALAALAAGSGVIFKPAPQAERCGALIAQALWDAGVPRDLLALVAIEEGQLGQHLLSHSGVDQVILTGAWDTAALFRSWRPDLRLFAETSGKDAIVITPSADLDLAVADLVRSAFAHAGQKCSAASLAILVGPVAHSARLRRQLVDATRSMRVGPPWDPRTEVSPLIAPPSGKLLWALTELDDGEQWLVAPEQLPDVPGLEGRLWSPGIRIGVKPGSRAHLEEFFGPMLSVLVAKDLKEAVELQNQVAYGLTAGIHTRDPEELAYWLEHVQAGNVYVNRGITGAIVRRQPFGGWKRSAVGPGAKAGGPNYLACLGSWLPAQPAKESGAALADVVQGLVDAASPHITEQQQAWLRAAVADDAAQWAAEFGVSADVSALGVERNVLRYLPVPHCEVRIMADAGLAETVRVLAAALLSGARPRITAPAPLPVDVTAALPLAYDVVADDAWLGEDHAGRVRLVGPSASEVAAALATVTGGDPDVAVYAGPVTASGRVELLPFLHEQAVALTAHRFGNPDPMIADVEL